MKAVNVRELKNNPSEALRMAKQAPVVVLNRDEPQAVLMHLDDDAMLSQEGVRLALAIALFRDGGLALGRAARLAAIPLAEFMQHLTRLGVPVVGTGRQELAEDMKGVETWLKDEPSSPTRAR